MIQHSVLTSLHHSMLAVTKSHSLTGSNGKLFTYRGPTCLSTWDTSWFLDLIKLNYTHTHLQESFLTILISSWKGGIYKSIRKWNPAEALLTLLGGWLILKTKNWRVAAPPPSLLDSIRFDSIILYVHIGRLLAPITTCYTPFSTPPPGGLWGWKILFKTFQIWEGELQTHQTLDQDSEETPPWSHRTPQNPSSVQVRLIGECVLKYIFLLTFWILSSWICGIEFSRRNDL